MISIFFGAIVIIFGILIGGIILLGLLAGVMGGGYLILRLFTREYWEGLEDDPWAMIGLAILGFALMYLIFDLF